MRVRYNYLNELFILNEAAENDYWFTDEDPEEITGSSDQWRHACFNLNTFLQTSEFLFILYLVEI